MARRDQSGMALLVFLLLLLAGLSALALGARDRLHGVRGNDIDRYAQLREAQRLLLGSSYRSNNRPGEIRPADSSGDGSGIFGSTEGHFPWRELQSLYGNGGGRSGEKLWYFAAPEFLDGSSDYLNYDSSAPLTLDGVGGYVAIIIAPGPALNEVQAARRPSSDITAVRAYLEDDNANWGDGDFVSHAAGDFNDAILGVHKNDLLARAADYAARKFIGRLEEYLDGPGCNAYPVPAAFDPVIVDDDNPQFTDMYSDPTEPRVGMLPISDHDVKPRDWAACNAGLNSNVDAFMSQRWFRFMRYARADGGSGGKGCTPGTDCLVVEDASGDILFDDVEALVIMSGVALDGQVWNSTLDESDLYEGDNADDDEVFTQAPESDNFNDRLFIISRSGS